MPTTIESVLIIAAYLMGSMASAIIVCKLMGLPDPRTGGSGNPGATNVLRQGGKKAAAITLLGDVLKGVVPVIIAHLLEVSALAMALVVMAAFLGHLLPVFFVFKGGKGVATAFGAMIALSPWLGGAVLLTWLAMAFIFRYSSLSALTAALLAPAYTYLLALPQEQVIAITAMSLILISRHHSNIRNLLTGKESKIGTKKPAS